MRHADFSAANTTRISTAFLRAALPVRAKALATVIASFLSIPGWQIRKAHIRSVCAGTPGFDAAWALLLKLGILSFFRRKDEKGRYCCSYELDRSQVCGQASFTLVPNEALHSALPLTAKWLYITCASLMTLPDFIFETNHVRKTAGLGHYCYHQAYTQLRDTGWLLVERVPGQKRRCYSLTRGDHSIVASTALPFRAQQIAVRYKENPAAPEPSEKLLLTQAHFRKLLSPFSDLNDRVVQETITLLAQVMHSTRTHYQIDGVRVAGGWLRTRFAALSGAGLHEVIRKIQRIPSIHNLPGYLLTCFYRLTACTPRVSKPEPQSTASYDLQAFEQLCLTDTYY